MPLNLQPNEFLQIRYRDNCIELEIKGLLLFSINGGSRYSVIYLLTDREIDKLHADDAHILIATVLEMMTDTLASLKLREFGVK